MKCFTGIFDRLCLFNIDWGLVVCIFCLGTDFPWGRLWNTKLCMSQNEQNSYIFEYIQLLGRDKCFYGVISSRMIIF